MKKLAAVIFLAIYPAIASANVGLPMLMVLLPSTLPVFIPVVLLESYILNKMLDVEYKSSINLMLKANILTTVVGIPVAWIAAFIVEIILMFLFINILGLESYPSSISQYLPEGIKDIIIVTLTAPWLGPWKDSPKWIIPFATIIMLIPCFFASYWVEFLYLKKKLSSHKIGDIKSTVWRANVYSYIMLLTICIVWLALNIE